MEPIQELAVTCQGATTVSLDELRDLQGNLKDLTEHNYVKLRNSLIEEGFSFPMFIWIDQEGTKWIIDAHQRLRTLKKMRDDGIVIPPIPADIIQARDKAHAKKKLAILNSRYGKITLEGWEEFIHEPGAEVEDSELFAIPEVELWEGSEEKKEDQSDGVVNPSKVREITCPNCQHKFNLFGTEEPTT